MKPSILIAFILFGIVQSYGQYDRGVKPDSVKFFTVDNLDTIEVHFEKLKPNSFTYFRTYYYPNTTRSFEEITGNYIDNQRSGKWVWYFAPISQLSEDCRITGPVLYVHYESDSIVVQRPYKGDIIIKHKKTDSISGTIYPPNLKSTRFLLKNGKWEFIDLKQNEIYYGHYEHLEETLKWFEREINIKLWPTMYKKH